MSKWGRQRKINFDPRDGCRGGSIPPEKSPTPHIQMISFEILLSQLSKVNWKNIFSIAILLFCCMKILTRGLGPKRSRNQPFRSSPQRRFRNNTLQCTKILKHFPWFLFKAVVMVLLQIWGFKKSRKIKLDQVNSTNLLFVCSVLIC